MVSVDRQAIMESNRSLRNIKNELETLLEKGVIDDSTFETITSALPPESSLSGPLRTTASSTSAAPAATPRASSTPQPQPPAHHLHNLTLGNPPTQHQQQPPSYNDTPAPGLPPRAPAAADPASSRPAIAHARALYRYVASDARDLSFDRDDAVLVYEYMNHDWWMGRNQRTGLEGIFPKSYVMVENKDCKAAYAPVPQQQQQQQQYGGAYGYGGPPPQQNPYNAAVPPMAVADGGQQQQQEQQQGGGGGKAGEYGKKFGKKLGNAAIFGAGASIGSNIVNSIF